MNKYDAMYIIRPSVDEESRNALISEINAIFTSRGSSEPKVKEWGLRKLAYKIDDETQGYYVDMEVETDSNEALSEYDRILNIKHAVIRHIIVKLPKDYNKE